MHVRDLRIARGLLACLAVAIVLASCDDGPPPTPAQILERDALVALYEATDGDTWNINRNWLTDEPLGRWRWSSLIDLTAVAGSHALLSMATGLRRRDSGGTEACLTGLEWLTLEGNMLGGEIPAALGDLSNLSWLNLADQPAKWGDTA